MIFQQKLEKSAVKNNSLVCVGLDSDTEKLPQIFKNQKYPQFAFNKSIIDMTHDVVLAYKPNSAFYEGEGVKGIEELKMTCDYIHEKYSDIPIILDAKRADIGSTNVGYVKYAFDYLGVDAITLQPYLGKEAIQPFLDRTDKGCIILCRTSNPGAGELQDLSVILGRSEATTPESDPRFFKSLSQTGFGNDKTDSGQARMTKEPLYKYVAQKVVTEWNTNGNCMLVVGATYTEELAEVRKLAGDMWFLVPGIGAQGGDIEKTVKAGLNSQKMGMVINSSRGIIFAKDPKAETMKLRDKINKWR